MYPLAAPSSRVVRVEELAKWDLAVKSAFHDFFSSSCTSGKKCTGAERGYELHSEPRYQLSNRKHSGQGGGFHSILMSSASEGISPPSNAAINSSSSSGALNEKLGSPKDEPSNSSMSSTGRDEHAEEWKVRGDTPGRNAYSQIALCAHQPFVLSLPFEKYESRDQNVPIALLSQ